MPDEVNEPLQGDRTLESLARYIDRRMPEDDPDLLDAEESRRVAEFIYGAFYSADARAKSTPLPKPAFARLTNRQFRESVADLIGSFAGTTPPGEGRGLKAEYFDSDGMNKKARKVLEREDPSIDFDFGEGPAAEGGRADQFSIAWEGSLLTTETGWHEFRITTPNGARLFLNTERLEGDRNHRDDSAARRQTPFIDAWVSSGSETREVTARAFLLGGRAYSFRLDYFKYLDPRGMIRLEWKPPRSKWEVLGAPFLSPSGAAHVAVVTTPFPADDASEGYERGTGISKDWHEATTAAAIEAANQVIARLAKLSGVAEDDPERIAKLKDFVALFAERAFRRPLDDDQRRLYVESPFEGDLVPEQAVKRAVILILKSPRFLYPEHGPGHDTHTVATRLALALWDSLPDAELAEAARSGRLASEEEIRGQARRMASDPRAKAKLTEFFRRWLKLDAEGEISKDPEAFPGFDAHLVADLRRSLELFVEKVVWSEASDYRELILADYLLFNDRLAGYYNAPLPQGGGFQPVRLDPDWRAGVLTHPYLLARLSHHKLTSPIHRGVFLTRNVLGGILKPPPEAIAFEDHKFSPDMTMREKVAEMTRNADCMTCHEIINPLGFTLENFDAVGRHRTTDGGRLIDPVAEFPSIEGETICLTGPRDLAVHAANSPAARRGFIRQLLQHTLKQNPAVYGHDTLIRLDETFTANGHHIRNLLVEIAVIAARQAAGNAGTEPR